MMRRLIVWIVGIGLLVALAAWLADNPGTARLEWRGWRVETSFAILLGGIAAVALVSVIVYGGLTVAARIPRRILLFHRGARREKGYRALTRGLVAAAAGDAAEAERQARRANDLLDDPPLTMLLSAQAAQLAGDDAAARRHFSGMLEKPETVFLALRGLIMQARREGDEDAALDYARRAFALRPKTPWVVTTLFDLLVGRGLWHEALSTVEAGLKNGIFTGEDGKRRRVVTLLACSAASGDGGETRRAFDFAKRAYELAPEFLPAALRYAGLRIGGGHGRSAARLIEGAWSSHPHPELARLYLSIAPGAEAIARMRRIERLASHNPSHFESHLALAAVAIEASLWGSARGHLEAAESVGECEARLCRLRADLEEAEHGAADAVRRWLLAAAEAPPDPAWVCADCGTGWRHWSPVCGHCEAFATLAWSRPRRVREILPAAGPVAGPVAAPDEVADPAPPAKTRDGSGTETGNPYSTAPLPP